MREKNELLDETTWRIIREAKGIAGWVAVSAVLGILAVLCSIAAPEILGDLIQKLYDFGLTDRHTPIRDSLVSGLLLLTAVYAAQGVFRYLNMQLMNRTVSRHFTCDHSIQITHGATKKSRTGILSEMKMEILWWMNPIRTGCR